MEYKPDTLVMGMYNNASFFFFFPLKKNPYPFNFKEIESLLHIHIFILCLLFQTKSFRFGSKFRCVHRLN